MEFRDEFGQTKRRSQVAVRCKGNLPVLIDVNGFCVNREMNEVRGIFVDAFYGDLLALFDAFLMLF